MNSSEPTRPDATKRRKRKALKVAMNMQDEPPC
jgi:hypothetical protein